LKRQLKELQISQDDHHVPVFSLENLFPSALESPYESSPVCVSASASASVLASESEPSPSLLPLRVDGEFSPRDGFYYKGQLLLGLENNTPDGIGCLRFDRFCTRGLECRTAKVTHYGCRRKATREESKQEVFDTISSQVNQTVVYCGEWKSGKFHGNGMYFPDCSLFKPFGVNFGVLGVVLRCLHPVQQNLLGKFQQWQASRTRSVAVRATSVNMPIFCVLNCPNAR
jgi:hypothetical protein